MSLSRADVDRVSLLARLRLSDAEADHFAAQLTQVVDYFRQLDELDTAQVAPMAHAIDLHNVFAADVLQPSLEREAALANAPKSDSECYRVPAVLGE
jgi:aspartyl-tRNA(Asn)/glutamyl-tRNA(Gln) amidotransferase subunit C